MRVVEEETEHFARCVRPARVRVGAVRAAAGSGVAAAGVWTISPSIGSRMRRYDPTTTARCNLSGSFLASEHKRDLARCR
jgi:hypothetical protein